MSMTVSTRIEFRSISKAKNQRHHDTREGGNIPNYVDRDRIKLNSIIVAPLKEGRLRQIRDELIAMKPRKRATKSDASITLNGIITFGTDAQPIMEALTKQQQNKLFLEAALRIADDLDTELTGLVVHRDERALHAHYQMPSYDRKGNSIADKTKRTQSKRLQDIVGEVFGRIGIKRGTPKAERIARGDDASKVTHRNVKRLHEDLPNEIWQLERKIEKYKRLLETSEVKLAENRGNIDKLQKNAEIYERRAQEAERALKQLERVMPTPKPITLEQVVSKKRRLFGFLPDRIKTAKVSAVKPTELTEWAHSVAAEMARMNQLIEEAEMRAGKAERRAKSVSEHNAMLTDKLRPSDSASMKDLPAPLKGRVVNTNYPGHQPQ